MLASAYSSTAGKGRAKQGEVREKVEKEKGVGRGGDRGSGKDKVVAAMEADTEKEKTAGLSLKEHGREEKAKKRRQRGNRPRKGKDDPLPPRLQQRQGKGTSDLSPGTARGGYRDGLIRLFI